MIYTYIHCINISSCCTQELVLAEAMHPTILFKKLLVFAAVLSEVKAAPHVAQVRDIDTRGEGNALIPRQANTCRNDLLYNILRALSASKFCTSHLQFTTPKTVYVTATRTMPTVTQYITNTVTTTKVQTVEGPPTATVLTTITVGEPRIVDQVVPVYASSHHLLSTSAPFPSFTLVSLSFPHPYFRVICVATEAFLNYTPRFVKFSS